jgi:hypothetical protein
MNLKWIPLLTAIMGILLAPGLVLAWDFEVSASAACPADHVIITATFTNKEGQAVRVRVEDKQTGEAAGPVDVAAGETRSVALSLDKADLGAGVVLFTFTWANGKAGEESATARYEASACLEHRTPVAPSPSPTAEASPSPSPTVEVPPSPSPTAEASPLPSPTAEASPSPSPTAEASPSPSPTAEASPSPSPTAEASPSPSPTVEVPPAPSPTTEVPPALPTAAVPPALPTAAVLPRVLPNTSLRETPIRWPVILALGLITLSLGILRRLDS